MKPRDPKLDPEFTSSKIILSSESIKILKMKNLLKILILNNAR